MARNEKKTHRPLLSAAMLMIIGNMAVKMFGLLREILVAKIYGTSTFTDAYIIANNIPTVLFAMFGAAIATTFIPMYSRAQKEEGERVANEFAFHVVEVLLAICCVLCILGEIWTEPIVRLFAAGFRGDAFSTTVSFAKILFPSIFGMVLMHLSGSYLQQHEKYLPISLVPAFGNITIIISLMLSELCSNNLIFVYGTLAGLTIQVLFYLPWVLKEGVLNREKRKISNDKYLLLLLPLILPVVLGEAVNDINSVVDKTLVSTLGTGVVSSISFAFKTNGLINDVITASLMAIAYPKLSKLSAQGDKSGFDTLFFESITMIISILLPVEVLAIILRNDIIEILFMRGNFNSQSAEMTSIAFALYCLGVIAIGVRGILVKVSYSKQNTRMPMINSVICAILNIVLDVFLIKIWGYKGVAIATSITAFVGAIIIALITRKAGYVNFNGVGKITIKVSVGTAVSCVFALLLKHLFVNISMNQILSTLCICCGYFGIFFVSQLLFNNKAAFLIFRTKATQH